jgi:hypothetical protein
MTRLCWPLGSVSGLTTGPPAGRVWVPIVCAFREIIADAEMYRDLSRPYILKNFWQPRKGSPVIHDRIVPANATDPRLPQVYLHVLLCRSIPGLGSTGH